MADEIAERLARLEQQLEEAQAELAALRALTEAPPTVELEPIAAATVPEPPPVAAPVLPDASAHLAAAWRALERGREPEALTEAMAAFRSTKAEGDDDVLDEIGSFAKAAMSTTSWDARTRAEELARRVEQRRKPSPPTWERVVPAAVTREVSRVPPTRQAAMPAPPPRDEIFEPTSTERAAAWLRQELTGARAFALAGGAVLLLGVIFLFVLAANRGWVGPAERVALGAAASLAAIAAGVLLRARYGRVVAAYGAVGAGIAGAYATLAAAAILYSYLPSWAALLTAAAVAATGGAIAVSWSSQILAGLALVGAAAAPGLYALDDEVSSAGVAFALVVFVAAIVVASPRRWLWLEVVIGAVSIAQVMWLASDAPADDAGVAAIVCVGVLTLLFAGVAWQAAGGEGLAGASASFVLAGGGLALLSLAAVLESDRRLGVVLLGLALAYGATALAASRRWVDLAWTIAAVALLLGGVAAALLVSGRSLTVVWAIEAAVLAALAWRLDAERFHAAALLYLTAAVVHGLAIEVAAEWPADADDVPRSAAAGLFVVSASALAVGLLQPAGVGAVSSLGVAAHLDPLWAALRRLRVEVRALLAVASAALLVVGLAAVFSGRVLTIVLAVLAVGLGLVAWVLGERRLQPFSFGVLAFAVLHALAVEVPMGTLAAERGTELLEPVPSLVALAAAAAALALFASFETRGIAWLGALEGPELGLAVLERGASIVRATLALIAATAACWAVGLLAIEASYDAGQVVSTALWSLLGVVVVVLAARRGSIAFAAAGFVYLALAFIKAAAFDWEQLGDGAAATALLVSAAALLAAGFAMRWESPGDMQGLEIIALATGATAAVAATVAFGHWIGYDSRSWGIATIAVAVVLVAVGVAPYARLRAGGTESWLRPLANGYWLIGLVTLLVGESLLVLRDDAATSAVWAATAGALGLAWKPLVEDRVWMAGLVLAGVATVGCVATVTVPSRLVDASEHPATGIWVLAIAVAAMWILGLMTPTMAGEVGTWVRAVAAGLTIYGLSLVVLELAERVSGATVETDFQRGHTALSALWGIGALCLYVVGLARDRRQLRVVGLAMFGLALAKLFLYDLASLSSITRAFSFLAVGAILLAAGFFAERLVKSDDDPA